MKKKKEEVTILGLQKGVEKKEHTKIIKKEKELSPNTVGGLKFIRSVVWILVVFIFLVGAAQMVRSKQPKIIKTIHKYEFAESESERAKTFAENFVRDYLTYGNIEENEYMERLMNYVNSSIVIGRPDYANGQSVVKETHVWDVKKINNNKSDIIIKAEVELTNNNELIEKYDEAGKKVTEPKKMEKVFYVSIPIEAKNNRVLVNDYPAFISVEDKLEAELETYSNEKTLEDNTKEEIKKMLEDFYDVYYSGTQGQIKTFFKKDIKLTGLNNEFIFKSIKSIEAYEETNNKVIAVVVLEVEQNDIGSLFNQRHLINLEKMVDRWVITSIKNRGN